MKISKFFGTLFLLLMATGWMACNDDIPKEPEDTVITIKMSVSNETGTHSPWGSDMPVECMLVKEENEKTFQTLSFSGITNFNYEKGFEYTLSVEKRILVNPPADGSNIAYKLIEVLTKAKVEYQYTINIESPSPFILSPDGGEYEIPFTCKRKKYVNNTYTEEEYTSLNGLKYYSLCNFGGSTYIDKDGDKTGFYKFSIQGIMPYNMEGTPQWYFAFYPAGADLIFGPSPEPIYRQVFEQPQTEGEDNWMYPVVYASIGTFDI